MMKFLGKPGACYETPDVNVRKVTDVTTFAWDNRWIKCMGKLSTILYLLFGVLIPLLFFVWYFVLKQFD